MFNFAARGGSDAQKKKFMTNMCPGLNENEKFPDKDLDDVNIDVDDTGWFFECKVKDCTGCLGVGEKVK